MTVPSTQVTTLLTQFGLTTAADELVPRLTQAGTARTSRPKRSANFCRLSFNRLRRAATRPAAGSTELAAVLGRMSGARWARARRYLPGGNSTTRALRGAPADSRCERVPNKKGEKGGRLGLFGTRPKQTVYTE